MSSWLQSQLKAAGNLLEAVDRTAQKVSSTRADQLRTGRQQDGPSSVGSASGEHPGVQLASVTVQDIHAYVGCLHGI